MSNQWVGSAKAWKEDWTWAMSGSFAFGLWISALTVEDNFGRREVVGGAFEVPTNIKRYEIYIHTPG